MYVKVSVRPSPSLICVGPFADCVIASALPLRSSMRVRAPEALKVWIRLDAGSRKRCSAPDVKSWYGRGSRAASAQGAAAPDRVNRTALPRKSVTVAVSPAIARRTSKLCIQLSPSAPAMLLASRYDA